MLAIYYFGPIAYRPFASVTWVFLAFALALFLVGFDLGWRWRRRRRVAAAALPERWYRRLVVTSVVAGAVLVGDYLMAGFTPGLAESDPLMARASQSLHLTTWATTVSYPFAVFAFSAMVFAVCRWRRRERGVWTWAGLLSPAFLMAANMLQAGRQTFVIVFLLLVSLLVLLWVRRAWQPRLRRVLKALPLLAIALALVAGYFTFVAVRRNPEGMTEINMLHRFGNVQRPGADAFLVGMLPPGSLVTVYGGLYYYSHQLSALDSILRAGVGPDGWGRSLLDWPLLELTRVGVDLRYDDAAVVAAMTATGENLWGWRTGFAEPVADFGYVGALLFVSVMAFLLGRFVRAATESGADAEMASAVWWLAAFVFAVQFFPKDGIFMLNTVACLLLRRAR
jgi:ABC-type thiamin/hydroxymethylpyrimidine transport system permease subunit